LPEGGLVPGLRVGNIIRFEAVAEAVREALDAVTGRAAAARPTRAAALRHANGNGGNGSNRGQSVTVVVPDAAVRVLLLEFDSLPSKVEEALPVVRFRLKKLLPFDADDAAISYEVMSSGRSVTRVLAVAMPRLVLAEYESVVRAAGYEPGAVMPSTLAALAGLGEGEIPLLVVNAGREGVTTAIVKGGVLLLHRTVDLGGDHRAASPRETVPVVVVEDAADEAPVETSIAAIAARMAAAGSQVPVTVPEIITEGSLEAPTSEVAQAVSVAAAYFEDTLQAAPAVVMSAGPMGAAELIVVLDEARIGMGPVAVQEMVDRQMLGAGAASAGQAGGVPLGWLAGVRGALAN
jgi:type IV pilus assembly protein PilM